MAYNAEVAQAMREYLHPEGATETRMFGGIAFMVDGHMTAGVHKNGAMFRVGKDRHAEARAMPGVGEMVFTGKPMQGYVEVSDEVALDPARCDALLAMSLFYVRSLPPKLEKPRKKG